jgi:hypothetical protein
MNNNSLRLIMLQLQLVNNSDILLLQQNRISSRITLQHWFREMTRRHGLLMRTKCLKVAIPKPRCTKHQEVTALSALLMAATDKTGSRLLTWLPTNMSMVTTQ